MATAEIYRQEHFAADLPLDCVHHDRTDLGMFTKVFEIILISAILSVLRDWLVFLAFLTLLVSDLARQIDVLD
jgi:hypothetical protein